MFLGLSRSFEVVGIQSRIGSSRYWSQLRFGSQPRIGNSNQSRFGNLISLEPNVSRSSFFLFRFFSSFFVFCSRFRLFKDHNFRLYHKIKKRMQGYSNFQETLVLDFMVSRTFKSSLAGPRTSRILFKNSRTSPNYIMVSKVYKNNNQNSWNR